MAILENSGKEFEIVNYLNDFPTEKELSEIIKMLAISKINLLS